MLAENRPSRHTLPVSRRCVIGVDLGGTNVRAAAVYENGALAGQNCGNPSRAQDGTPAILDALAATIREAISGADDVPEAIGIAIPGHIDDPNGRVVWAPNFGETTDGVFRHWEDVAIRAPLQEQFSIPIVLGNDANLAALGEYRFGCGKNQARCLVLLTLGTGIGGGVVMAPGSVQGDARGPLLLVGGNQGGAELGHTVILAGGLDCNAGSYGAIEAYCRRDAIVARAHHKLRRGRPSRIVNLAGGSLGDVTPLVLSEAAAVGDEVAIEVFQEVGHYLGIGIGNFINIFAPDIVAVGGQIGKAGELILESARQTARDTAIPSLFRDCTIRSAQRIDDAGVLGGAAWALEATR